MLSYSPYDNLSAQAYPAMFVGTGLWDSQVQYWEPAKYVAKLRDLDTGGQPILLRTNMDAGHGGKSGRFRRYRELAEMYAFLLDRLEVETRCSHAAADAAEPLLPCRRFPTTASAVPGAVWTTPHTAGGWLASSYPDFPT